MENNTGKVCCHCFVAGRVQGVFYRDSTRNKALELALTGWVRNCPDGRVEVMACGEKEAVAALQDWCRQGPPAAEVREVVSEAVEWKAYEGFEIWYT